MKPPAEVLTTGMPEFGGCIPVGGSDSRAEAGGGAMEGPPGNPDGAATTGGGEEEGFNRAGAKPGTENRGDGRAVAGAIP